MITFFNPDHLSHAPEYEFYRGQRVPCFEKPVRADYVRTQLLARGHALQAPDVDSTPVLAQVHTARYLRFIQTAWAQWLAMDAGSATHAKEQPFPSVWPIRTLRSDAEPDNFIAKLGLYSMDNGTPLVAGTWAAAKAGADTAASAAAAIAQGAHAAFCATRPAGHHAVGAVISSQKLRNCATRFSGALPAMIAALIAPIEMPATQSGRYSEEASAS